ncbi:MAG: sulfite exporter TauE/SafE family protein [Ginsengibacter sp.]
MIQIGITAFLMGLLGSFHCIGMCGPIALSLPLKDTRSQKISGALFYNSGRIVTYSAFGFIFGIIGKSFVIFGFQQWLSILLGVVILILLIIPRQFSSFKNKNFVLDLFGKIRRSIGFLFQRKNYRSLFSIGLLNGLLPCGLVYMAAAFAVAAGSITNSIIFMAFFGLGTLPMMWTIAFFGNYVSVGLRQKIRKAYPYITAVLACLLILRGMGLNIPYISPAMDMGRSSVEISCGEHSK